MLFKLKKKFAYKQSKTYFETVDAIVTTDEVIATQRLSHEIQMLVTK